MTVDRSGSCKGAGRDAIKTEQTFVQGLVRGITGSLYNPWDMNYTRARETASSPKGKR